MIQLLYLLDINGNCIVDHIDGKCYWIIRKDNDGCVHHDEFAKLSTHIRYKTKQF